MKINEWIAQWERSVPLSLQESWDHSGKQIGRFDQELRGIVLSLDLTEAAVEAARQCGANLIFTHHPPFFYPVFQLTDAQRVHRLLLGAVEEGIAVYSSHTPLDKIGWGVNGCLGELLGLTEIQCLEKTGIDFEGAACEAPSAAAPDAGQRTQELGVVGTIGEQTLEAFAALVKERLAAPHILFYGNRDTVLHRVGIVGGAGMDYAGEAIERGCQAFLTADIKYHEALEALERGIVLVDAGHYWSEQPVMARVGRWIEEHTNKIPYEIVQQKPEELRNVL